MTIREPSSEAQPGPAAATAPESEWPDDERADRPDDGTDDTAVESRVDDSTAGSPADENRVEPGEEGLGESRVVDSTAGLPADENRVEAVDEDAAVETGGPLLTDRGELADRWDAVQAGFVDDPAKAVERADALVSEVIAELTASLARERATLSARPESGAASTEDLRVAFQRYRAVFDRLVAP